MYYWKIKDINAFEKNFADFGFKLFHYKDRKIAILSEVRYDRRKKTSDRSS